MRRRVLWVLVVGLGFILARPTGVAGYTIIELPTVRLKSRAFTPRAGLDPKLTHYVEDRRQERAVHVLIQFGRKPKLDDMARLNGKGIRLLDTVPERACFAAVPVQYLIAQRLTEPIRWIGVILPADKISPQLLREGVPEWARRPDNSAELIVEFFGDVREVRQKEVLHTYGAQVVARIIALNGWQIVLPEKRIRKLAQDDRVKWIETIPGPPEEDNDGVRSPTGINADPLLRPNVYDLTGNGVVVGQWESCHASFLHPDLLGKIFVADQPRPDDRSYCHVENAPANGSYDDGEAIYCDTDDSGDVSVADTRVTAAAAFPAGSLVAAGDPDVGAGIVLFQVRERFTDTPPYDWLYNPGEGIYRDADNSWTVSAGDQRLTPVGAFPASSVVAAGDGDIGQDLLGFPRVPHGHATHVAGTVVGSGAHSASHGGSTDQWKGVAAGATIRSYDAYGFYPEYPDAVTNGVTISTNSWGFYHCHTLSPTSYGYDANSQFYDAVISSRRSDGTSSGIGGTVLIVSSSGNQGGPERHTDNVALNGQYDDGESIYWDRDDDGRVSGWDVRLTGPVQPNGTTLVNFTLLERHREVSSLGSYNAGEAIYLDGDNSRTVSVSDTRLTAIGGFVAGSIVATGDTDIAEHLRRFRLWGNVRIPNNAKDSVMVANISSDLKTLAPDSSRGPTCDGRVKPDLAGPGSQIGGDGGVTSTYPAHAYATMSGTSMSTPAVSSSAALLTEWYRTLGAATRPAPNALKALLTHSCEDLTTIPNVPGNFEGPDFAFGYGRVRAKEAVDLVPHHIQSNISSGAKDYQVTVGAMNPLKVTLVWDDPAWTVNAAPAAATGILQNDLDLLLIGPNGTRYAPWVANGDDPFTPATRQSFPPGAPTPDSAWDHRNTVEQVVVPNAQAGVWTIRVRAYNMASWVGNSQDYTLVSEAIRPQDSPCTSTPAVDVWMRDNSSDTGAIPSSGAVYYSPDIWNRLAPDGGTVHENPEYGQTNYFYATIRNASTTDTAKATSIDVWIAPTASGLTWPDDFTHAGRISVANLAPGETRQVGPLAWSPPSPLPSPDYCIYVRAMSPQDPITLIETPNLWYNTTNSNNIVWRNLVIVDLHSRKSIVFSMRNTERETASVDLRLRIPEDFVHNGGRVFLRLSPELFERWPQEYRKADGLELADDAFGFLGQIRTPIRGKARQLEPREEKWNTYQLTRPEIALRGIQLRPREAGRVRLVFESADTRKASYDIDVIQEVGGKPVGGIRYVVRTGYGK